MTEIKRPPATSGLRHVALYAERLDECLYFYIDLLGMKIEWQPDDDNYYLTSGNDNLALHRSSQAIDRTNKQVLDHLGFYIE